MDPIRLVVVLVAFACVGAFAFLAANSERQVDAGSAVGFVSESVAFAGTVDEVDPSERLLLDATPGSGTAPARLDSGGDSEGSGGDASTPSFPDPADRVRLSEEQWEERLTPEQFYVLREAGTERRFTSPLDKVKDPGWFTCAGCGNLLFETATKFDSGTGWPSFWAPVAARHVVEEAEGGFFNRIEVRCARCDGHLGHVFNDGPADQTGLRYCMNGVAMQFTPKGG